MCGIFAFVGTKNCIDPELSLNLMQHRGPDSKNYHWLSEGLHQHIMFGHVRLSIQDVRESSNQPMTYQEVTIIFNGEIYNFIELRNELEALKHKFHTGSDTEVVLKSYIEWGTECFNRFNGDWALCIHDNRNQKVIISRDRFGIKPLYFYQDKNELIFSSNIKSINKFSESYLCDTALS